MKLLLDLVAGETVHVAGKSLQRLVGRKHSDFTQGFSARGRPFGCVWHAFLIPGQRFDGVELRGFSDWKKAKYDTCQKGARESNDGWCDRENHAPACYRRGRYLFNTPPFKSDTPEQHQHDDDDQDGADGRLFQAPEAHGSISI